MQPSLTPRTTRLIRRLLDCMVRGGGIAMGVAAYGLITQGLTDWRWPSVGGCGFLVGLLAIWLIAYFPTPSDEA